MRGFFLGQSLGERWRGQLEFREHQGGQSESAGMGNRGERQYRQFRERQLRVVWGTPPRIDWSVTSSVGSLESTTMSSLESASRQFKWSSVRKSKLKSSLTVSGFRKGRMWRPWKAPLAAGVSENLETLVWQPNTVTRRTV
jgi:hypothetical protein